MWLQTRSAPVLLREVVAAENFDAVDGVGNEEEDEAAEPLGQQDENVDRAGGGDDRGGKHDAARIEMDEFGEDEIDAGREGNADEGEQIGGGDDAALVFFGRAMLDERVDGNGEESGPETERAEQDCRTDEAGVHGAEGDAGATSCRWSRAE